MLSRFWLLTHARAGWFCSGLCISHTHCKVFYIDRTPFFLMYTKWYRTYESEQRNGVLVTMSCRMPSLLMYFSFLAHAG
jgi:hypothetical protein